MKKQNIETGLVLLCVGLAVFQIIYLMIYAYGTRNNINGETGVFLVILAFELLFIFLYVILIIQKIIKGTTAAVLALKEGNIKKLPSSMFSGINNSLGEIKDYYEKKAKKEDLKKELLIKCIKISGRIELLRAVMPQLIDITEADACCYYFVNYGTNKLEIMDSYGFNQGLYKELDMSIGEGLEGLCCKTGKTCVTTLEKEGDRYSSKSKIADRNYKNIMAVPVMCGDSCVGVITLAYLGTIHKENIAYAEELVKYFAASHDKNTEFERYSRQMNDINLQYNLIRDITFEVHKKEEEIKELKEEIEALKKG